MSALSLLPLVVVGSIISVLISPLAWHRYCMVPFCSSTTFLSMLFVVVGGGGGGGGGRGGGAARVLHC